MWCRGYFRSQVSRRTDEGVGRFETEFPLPDAGTCFKSDASAGFEPDSCTRFESDTRAGFESDACTENVATGSSDLAQVNAFPIVVAA